MVSMLQVEFRETSKAERDDWRIMYIQSDAGGRKWRIREQ